MSMFKEVCIHVPLNVPLIISCRHFCVHRVIIPIPWIIIIYIHYISFFYSIRFELQSIFNITFRSNISC